VEPISRRRALQLGLLGAASLGVGGVGLWRTTTTGPRSPVGSGAVATPSQDELIQPAVLASQGGLLNVELTAAERVVDLAGTRANALTYGQTVPGPTWQVRPGDRIQVRLVNELDTATNLHVHGLQVSPTGNGDNPFLVVGPGTQLDFEFQLPDAHPPGTFWYHPHLHEHAADQVFGGLYGAIVVADDVTVTRERVMVISDISLTGDGSVRRPIPAERMAGREGELVLVNGQHQPRLTARPGEVERWRIVNACTSRYLDLAIDGPGIQVLAMDAQRTPLQAAGRVLLAPGNRAELLVTARDGIGELRTVGYDRGSPMMGMMGGGATGLSGPVFLATLVADGAPAASPRTPQAPVATPDLRDRTPDRTRELTITMGTGMGMGAMTFGFDGQAFDHRRTDQLVRSGALEQWTIRNPTRMDHPFHLHVWPMQVVEADGAALDDPTWRDVVNVPAGGHVTVLIDFTGITGRTVYHCHILDHEDLGMMGVIEVT